MTKSRKFLTALILSAIIISSSGCEFSENSPAISPEASSESSSKSSSLPESLPEVIITPESSEPEENVEEEPVIEPAISFLSQTAERGSYFVLSAENIDLTDFSFEDPFGYNRRFFQKDGIWYCLIPVDPSTDAGYYPLEISCGDFEFKTTITVADRKFKRQYLIVDQVTLDATLEDAAVREAFAAFFEEKRWNFTEEKLWNGEFTAPLGDSWYRETTSYGTFRTFSSGRTEWHNATDMAVGGGTPIFATNSGKILFADWLGLTGNTIIIDHGCGI
ncbi:MAG: M23 family metallopeptidase, partial [Oscillospiraceae bacterium]|nr:M23 family metallopeptidase [Oscillospiraceae bacterium]